MDMYSVDQVASLLGLHVRTVRAYVREGRLKAVRIGKQYRISKEDLEALTGRSVASMEPEPVRRTRHVEVSIIVQADVVSPETADKISKMIIAISGASSQRSSPLNAQAVYSPERAHLKVVLIGDMDTTASLLKMIDRLLAS